MAVSWVLLVFVIRRNGETPDVLNSALAAAIGTHYERGKGRLRALLTGNQADERSASGS